MANFYANQDTFLQMTLYLHFSDFPVAAFQMILFVQSQYCSQNQELANSVFVNILRQLSAAPRQ